MSIPYALLITCETVTEHLPLASGLSEHQSLTLFLAHLNLDHSRSDWNLYFQSIPESFNTMSMRFPLSLHQLLPINVQSHIARQLASLESDLEAILQRVSLDRELLTWAWMAVNTRCISLLSKTKTKPGAPTMALAPFLDLLNHSGSARIETGIDLLSQSFFIKTLQRVNANEQVFISYGPHDNAFLLCEYGFILDDNPYNYVAMDTEHVHQKLGKCTELERILMENGIFGDYTLQEGEASYRLLNAIRLGIVLKSDQKDQDSELNAWKKVLSGEKECVSETNEAQSKEILQAVCQERLLEVKHALINLQNMAQRTTQSLLKEQISLCSRLRSQEQKTIVQVLASLSCKPLITH